MKRLAACALVVAFVLAASPRAARADETEACVAAYEKAQELRIEKRLRAAREQLVVCSQTACPKAARDDCAQWLGEIDLTLPSIVVSARRAGRVVPARVFVDGAEIAGEAAARPIQVDPGAHTVRVEPADGIGGEARVELEAGDVARAVAIDLPAPPASPALPPPTAPARSTIPTGAWIAGAVGAVALGGFAYFGLSGRSKSLDLQDTCYPRCADADVRSANAKLLVADVSLGVAIVAVGVAVWLYVTNHDPPRTARTLGWSF